MRTECIVGDPGRNNMLMYLCLCVRCVVGERVENCHGLIMESTCNIGRSVKKELKK